MFFESHFLSHISISRFCMLQMSLESVLFWFLSPQPVFLGKDKCHAESCSASSKKNQCCAVTSFPLTKEFFVWAISVSSKVHLTWHFQGVLFSEDGLLTSREQPYQFCIHINRHGIVTDGVCLGLAFFLTVQRRVLNQTALDDPSARGCSWKYWKGKKIPFIYSYSHPS